MDRSVAGSAVLIVLLLFCLLQSSTSHLILDYSLYSHLNYELNYPSDSSDIVNYYRLNKQTIEPFSQYLHFPDSERERLKNLAKEMFQFGYDNYMQHAFPMDELDPIHCRGRGPDHANPNNININDSLGDYLLTLVDSLSTLAVMGNSSEFTKAARLVIDNLSFDKDSTVQVFEATIRVLGGLISAHLIATDVKQPFGNMTIPNYDNELLKLASDLGARLLAAFENKDTPIPSPRVNLRYGVPMNGIRSTCTSGAGTLLLEFGMLSTLLNDPIYEKLARRSVYSIYSRRSNETGLFGNELDSDTGEWIGVMSGLGAGIDSYFEYLIKSYILFGDKTDLKIYQELKDSLKKYLRQGRAECSRGDGHHPIYLNVHMSTGKVFNNWIDSLQASFPGVQVSDGDLDEAICFHALYFAIWKKFGVLPERYNWNLKLPDVYFYPLRPEFAEATYFLYRATRNPFYLHVAKLIIHNIYELTKVECGFATVHDVLDKSLEDRMESFFLSETLKYLYLIFDKENNLNKEGETEYLFTTEGHLFPIKQTYEARNSDLMSENDETTSNSSNSSYTKRSYDQMGVESRGTTTNDSVDVDDELKKSLDESCQVNASQRSYYNLRHTLPMKIHYFDQLFEAVGLNDNLQLLLERKSS